jgi:hypothetical protein
VVLFGDTLMNDFDKLIQERLWGFDFEVTMYDWLLVLIKYSDKTKITFHNDIPDNVYKFIFDNNPILIGHNARYYDQYILKAILSGFSVGEVKEVNDYIINGGQGFELQYDNVQISPIWDTIQDIVPPKSLKEIEANLLMDITESTVSFDIDHPWNEEEYKEMLYYCTKDVEALFPLFEARKSYFKTKYDLCILSGIDTTYNMGLTNAKLCAKFLEAEKIDRDDEREFVIPKTIDLNYVPKEILNFFERVHDKTISDEELFTSKLEFDFHGMPSVFASGGAHGALPNYSYDEKLTPNKVVINVDYSSLYPHLLALPEYNFISRNIKDKNKYYDTLQRRLKLKHEGKKEEQLPLKLILNTTYGCQNNKYNDLYDPKGARNTCWTGQLLLASMTEEVFQIGDVKLIQINTDGLMVELPREKLPQYYDVCNNFSKRVKIGVEYDIIHKIIQRDVNNYILLYGDNEHLNVKAKGGCFASLPKLTIENDGTISSKYKPDFKANSLAIVSEALAKYLLFDIPIEETILNENIIHKYQQISHLGSTYEKCVQESPNGDILLQKNNRVYAGLKPSGKIIKVKPDGRRDSLANQAPNPIIDNGNKCTIDQINKQWYIKLATQWANDFLGIKRLTEYKKEELLTMANDLGMVVDKKIKKDDLIKLIEERNEVKNMATKKVETNEEVKTMTIYEKIAKMTKEIREHDFIMDCANPGNLGGKEYASIGQYYNLLHNLCDKYRLLFKWNVMELESFEKDVFKPTGKMPSNVAIVSCTADFIDLDDTQFSSITYSAMAGGSDIADKSVSGASTLAFRNWFDKNFTPKYMNTIEEEITELSEEKTEAPKIPTYIPTERKEEIKKEVVETKQHEESDDEDIKEVIGKIMKVRELSGNDEWGKETLKALYSGEVTSADILAISLKVDTKLESLEVTE